VLQQYESDAQICVTHASQPLVSATPVVHSLCVQLGVLPQVCPQIELTSPTQTESQLLLQQ
jgi:hypothetical protein